MLKLLEEGVMSKSVSLQQWTEAAASLSEWFIQPQRLHLYADIVEPYLLGVAKASHFLLLQNQVLLNFAVFSFVRLMLF